MRSLAVLFFLAASCALAQPYRYSATTGDVSLAGAGTSFTIQEPALNGRVIALEAIQVYCSVACNVSQAANGAAATTTAGTTSALLPTGAPAVATVWTASNVGAGTVMGGILHLPAGATQAIDVSKIVVGPGAGAAANYTVTISSITGTANITLIWSER